MLLELSIRNILYIDRLDLTFGPGLNVLTGETGAGKSILLDALGFVTGVRAGRDLLARDIPTGDVSAGFQVSADHPALACLGKQEIPSDGDILLRRTITQSGRTASFVNDVRITADQLARIGGHLVDIHGAHRETGLLNPAEHGRLLDAFADIIPVAGKVRALWVHVADLERRRAALAKELAALEEEADYTSHVIAELESLALEDGEVATLEARRNRLKTAQKLRSEVATAQTRVGMEGALGPLLDAIRVLERLDPTDSPALASALGALTAALHEIEEAQVQIDTALRDLEVAPGELEACEDRLYLIRQLARKHQVPPDALPAVLASLTGARHTHGQLAGEIDTVTGALKAAREAHLQAARRLSGQRRTAARALDRAIAGELEALRLKGVGFLTDLAETPPRAGGLDKVTFTVSTVPGAPPGPLDRVASGGEMARFMLAIKVCLAGTTPGLSIIFDEIDRGVGGATAAAIGKRLAALAGQNQTIIVTHSPQVAAHGHSHLLVQRVDSKAGTAFDVRPLEGSGRVDEIARMLAGATVTTEARAAARRLLGDGSA